MNISTDTSKSTVNTKQPRNGRSHPDKESVDAELIGAVYEVAFDPDFWPDLLEGIANLINNNPSNNLQSTTLSDDDFEQTQFLSNKLNKGESKRLKTLLPHLYRALKLKREYHDADHARGQAQAIVEQFPIGVLLVNDQGELISANRHAFDTIAQSNAVFLKKGVLCTTAKKQAQQLKDHIYKAANTPRDDQGEQVLSIRIDEGGERLPISLLISPDLYPRAHYDKKIESCAVIFIASALVKQKISESHLQTMFSLSRAEARLAALLASGVSLSQAAEQCFISKNTAKAQLKSVFYKMGVGRQAELVKLILTSPAVFSNVGTAPENAGLKSKTILNSLINVEDHLILSDGRRLQYAEYGDPQGKPVIHLHGILGCRYERLPNDRLTRELGVRLIIPDRPGYGLSEYSPGHNYLDFASDLLELVDRLDIQLCSIMGLSVGAVYGSAFAYKTPHRLRNLSMISLTPPFSSFSDFSGLPSSLKLLLAFSKFVPTAARMIAEIAIKNACNNPEKFLANVPISASDRTIFSNSLLMQHFEECLLAGSKDCHSGFVDDILLAAEPWAFPVEDIRIKIDFWHGTEDVHSPISRIKPVIDAVPEHRLFCIDGGGHFLIYDHWQEILESLTH